MKKMFFLFMIAPAFCFSQKLEEKKYDRFDSLQKITTAREVMVGKTLSAEYLASF